MIRRIPSLHLFHSSWNLDEALVLSLLADFMLRIQKISYFFKEMFGFIEGSRGQRAALNTLGSFRSDIGSMILGPIFIDCTRLCPHKLRSSFMFPNPSKNSDQSLTALLDLSSILDNPSYQQTDDFPIEYRTCCPLSNYPEFFLFLMKLCSEYTGSTCLMEDLSWKEFPLVLQKEYQRPILCKGGFAFWEDATVEIVEV